jgi:endonuclease YncB( thermonuclease family)|uniref:TNase-like domain-containing protein n=1 Tax=Desulfomonile tiedjei TaxID=2358 RepID=A0A7C4EVL1_9BACT
MPKVKIEKEWRIWLAVGGFLLLLVLYLYIASRPPTEGGENLWRVTKVIGPTTLSLKSEGKVVEFRIAGLKVPQDREAQMKDFLAKTLESKWVRIKVLREGKGDLREGLLYLSGEDISARLVRLGMAEIDREEQGFDVRPYIELEQEARREKKGIWSEK